MLRCAVKLIHVLSYRSICTFLFILYECFVLFFAAFLHLLMFFFLILIYSVYVPVTDLSFSNR